jgi:GR25 family glycosyltransferase involved in LPS biosynthesis
MNLSKISKCFFINLNSSKDRLFHFNQNINFKSIRFPASTGDQDKLLKISQSEYGCFCSHAKLWKLLSDSPSLDNILILEDDVYCVQNFINLWNSKYSLDLPEGFDIVYLGGNLPNNLKHYHKALYGHNSSFLKIRNNSFFKKDKSYWHMTTESYILSKGFASVLYYKFLNFDFSLPLDHFLSNLACEANTYHLSPLCFFQNKTLQSTIKRN